VQANGGAVGLGGNTATGGTLLGNIVNSGTLIAVASASGSDTKNIAGAQILGINVDMSGGFTTKAGASATGAAVIGNVTNAGLVSVTATGLTPEVFGVIVVAPAGRAGATGSTATGATFMGNIVNTGTVIAVGSPTSSVSQVTSFNQTAGGTLVMQVTSNTAAHPVVNAGTVTVGSGSIFEVAELGSGFARKQTYADVVVSGVPFANNFTVTSLIPLFQPSLVADPTTPNALDLVLNSISLCGLSGLTFNQHSAGCRFDALAAVASDPASLAFLGAVGNQSLGALPPTLDNIAGSQIPQTNYQALQDTQTALDIVLNHLAGGGISAPFTASLSHDGLRLASLGTSDTPSQVAQSWGGTGSGPLAFWFTGYGSFATAGNTIDALGFSGSTGGAVAAIEYDAGNGLLFGGAFDYAHGTLAFNANTGSSDIDAYLFMPYARWRMDDWYASGVGAIGWNNFTSNRMIAFPGFSADANGTTSGLSYGVRGEAGYDFHCAPAWVVTPVARVSYAGLNTDSFIESGGPAALAVNAQTSESLTSAIGGRVTTKLDFGGIGILTPEAHAFWQHEFLNAQTQVTAAFVGAPLGQFVTISSNFGRDSGLVGFALSSDPNADIRLSLSYDAQFNGSFTSQTVSAGFHARF